MSFTPISAFAVVVLCFAIGEVISYKTKGYVSSFIFAIAVVIFFGSSVHLFPEDLIEIAGLSNILTTFGMGLMFVSVGSNLKFSELLAEWKTIVVSLVSLLGVILICFTLGTAIWGREYALSAIGTICGGLGSTLVTSDFAAKAGRTDIAIFVTTMMTFQSLVGIPIASVCLAKSTHKFIADGKMLRDAPSKVRNINIKFISGWPVYMQSNMMYFARLALVAWLGEWISRTTGVNVTVCYLFLGFFATEIGFLEKGSLKKCGGEGFVLLGAYAYLMINFLSLTFGELFEMLYPIVGLLLVGAAAAGIAGLLAGSLLHWDPWISVAVGVTCLIGYPFTYGLAAEAVNSNTRGKGYTEVEIQRLTNYVLPKMVIGGVTSVSIASVLIAAYLAPMIFSVG